MKKEKLSCLRSWYSSKIIKENCSFKRLIQSWKFVSLFPSKLGPVHLILGWLDRNSCSDKISGRQVWGCPASQHSCAAVDTTSCLVLKSKVPVRCEEVYLLSSCQGGMVPNC